MTVLHTMSLLFHVLTFSSACQCILQNHCQIVIKNNGNLIELIGIVYDIN